MTDTVPANATALPSRRNLIAQASMLASIGTVGATMALPAFAAEPGPIERMHAEHVRLTAIEDAAMEATWDAEERYEEPERPAWHPLRSAGSYRIMELPGQTARCCLDDRDRNVAELRGKIAAPYVVDPQVWKTEAMHQAGVDRAKDTLAQIEAWQAEDKRCADAAGLTQAREAEALAAAAVKQHAARVFSIEPATFREAAFRAAVLLMTWHESEAGELVEKLVALAGIEPHHLG